MVILENGLTVDDQINRRGKSNALKEFVIVNTSRPYAKFYINL